MIGKNKDKGVYLGTVIKIHPSGIGETNKGHKAFNVQIGDKLIKHWKSVEIVKKSNKEDAETKADEDAEAKQGE